MWFDAATHLTLYQCGCREGYRWSNDRPEMGCLHVDSRSIRSDGLRVALRREAVGWDYASGRTQGYGGGCADGTGWEDVEDDGASGAGGAGELLGYLVWALSRGDAGIGSVVAGDGTEACGCGCGFG